MFSTDELPFCLRILLEQCVRKCGGSQFSSTDVYNIIHWQSNNADTTIPFHPARVIFQDFTYAVAQ